MGGWTPVSMMGIGMRYVQVCLDDARFTDVEIDVGKPVIQGRWKNFRKSRECRKRYRNGNLWGVIENMDYE
jgi:hypothetical protein